MRLRVGQVFRGFCRGLFGRDSYGEKRIEAIGYDWLVAREEDGNPVFCSTDGSIEERFARVLEGYPAEDEP